MKTYPVVLSIAGSDPSGGAGIQADIKTISAIGGFAATAITAVTVQNTLGVSNIQDIQPDIVDGQIEAVLQDLPVKAIKIGMIHSPELIDVIVNQIKKYKPPFVVLDPVMVSTSKDKLTKNETITKMIEKLFPLADLITPNLDEASFLCQKQILSVEDMVQSAKSILNYGVKSVLIKGGHLDNQFITDILMNNSDKSPHLFTEKKIESHNLHGTGCTLSSAIATYFALGFNLYNAVCMAKKYITQAINQGKVVLIGQGNNGAVNHFFNPQPIKIIDL